MPCTHGCTRWSVSLSCEIASCKRHVSSFGSVAIGNCAHPLITRSQQERKTSQEGGVDLNFTRLRRLREARIADQYTSPSGVCRDNVGWSQRYFGLRFLCVFDDRWTHTLCSHVEGHGGEGASKKVMPHLGSVLPVGASFATVPLLAISSTVLSA